MANATFGDIKPVFLAVAEALLLNHHVEKLNINPKKEEYDLILSRELHDVSHDFISSISTVLVNGRVLSFIKLNRPITFNNLFNELKGFQLRQVVRQCFNKDISPHGIEDSNIGLSYYLMSSTPKDPFLNLATNMLLKISSQVIRYARFGMKMSWKGSLDNKQEIEHCLASFPTIADIYSFSSKFKSQDSFDRLSLSSSFIVTTSERKDVPRNSLLRLQCGSFQVIYSDETALSQLLGSYLSKRYQDVLNQAQERLHENPSETERHCQEMMPFIVLYDFFSSSTPFQPLNPSPQCMRDSVFIYYNVARIAQLQKLYSSLQIHTDKVDVSMLTLDIEWGLSCHLINFYKTLEEAVIKPYKSIIIDRIDSRLELHKLLQYTLKLVKLFSKYYSSTKIITYDSKEQLVVRMNTRMQLVNSVFNVLTFILEDILGMNILSEL